MKIKYLLILFIIILLLPAAGNTIASPENTSFKEIRNPFQSWLPKIEEVVEKTQETTKIIKEVPKLDIKEKLALPIKIPKAVEKPKEPPRIRITGLIWNSDRPQAIINGRVVSEGDALEDFTIVRIHPKGIDINFFDEIITIEIEKTQINAI